MGCDLVHNNQSTDKLNRVLLLTDGKANRGICDPQTLIATAKEKAGTGIITTTIGFGRHFNEDLLINIAEAAEGNFYFFVLSLRGSLGLNKLFTILCTCLRRRIVFAV